MTAAQALGRRRLAAEPHVLTCMPSLWRAVGAECLLLHSLDFCLPPRSLLGVTVGVCQALFNSLSRITVRALRWADGWQRVEPLSHSNACAS